jgi:MoaA/NifB/PqqE/SkfB family radical SAM enzyme
MSRKVEWGKVSENGTLQLPEDLLSEMGFTAGAKFKISFDGRSLTLSRSLGNLQKIYIEPTNRCNLTCTMCIRNSWDEPIGDMTEETFSTILNGLDDFSTVTTISFSGLGEPLAHPNIVDWIKLVKDKGANVELITNGTLLTEKMSRALIAAGLDILWVSIDSATPESFADVRLGAQLSDIITNLKRFHSLRPGGHHPRPKMGIAFVAMKSNISEMPKVMQLARSVGAKLFSASNVMPYTEETVPEMLYVNALKNITYLSSDWLPQASLPKLDLDQVETQESFIQALKSGWNIDLSGQKLSDANDICKFIENNSTSVAWDGGVSPCWPLMHTHHSYLHNKPHVSYRHVIGFLKEHSLLDLWLDPQYVEYRHKVQDFSFAPCTFCGGCDLSLENMEDCVGNEFPACGTCLWSQGIIQCP